MIRELGLNGAREQDDAHLECQVRQCLLAGALRVVFLGEQVEEVLDDPPELAHADAPVTVDVKDTEDLLQVLLRGSV